jgi:hypothetical protein
VEAIRTAATALGVGELYGLFACMVTARSWNAIQRGMEVSLPSEQCCGSGMFIPDAGSRIQNQKQKRGVKIVPRRLFIPALQ